MAKVSETYTGQFVTGAELQPLGQRRNAVIHAAVAEVVGPDASAPARIVLDLVTKNGVPWPRRVVLNKGNANTLAAAYGDDCDDWAGKPISIWSEMVMFKGKSTPGIKIAADAAPPMPMPPRPQGPSWDAAGGGGLEGDEIPFGPCVQ
jgi:hypothetical protein